MSSPYAIFFENVSYTYEDLTRIAYQRASQLKEMGIQPQDRVMLLLPNSPDFIFWYFAILHLGGIVVPLHISLGIDEIQTVMTDCTASLIITHSERKDLLNHFRLVLITEEVMSTRESRLFSPLSYQEEDVAAILYTSGTTGIPKGVTLTFKNIGFIANSISKYCKTKETDRLLLAVPISHCFGQNLIMHHALHSGASIVLTRNFTPNYLKEVIEKERVTMVFGVPTMYRLILQTSATKEEFSSVRYCHSGAAPLDRETFEKWSERFGIPIHQGYGLTETSPLVCYNNSPLELPDSIGRPIDQVKVILIDENQNEIVNDEAGEIVISGPNVMKEYWNHPGETTEVLKDGWLYSGDIGRRDHQGNLYLVDRKKDLINVSGLKVYPTDVEKILMQHPSVEEAAVFGVFDSISGEQVKAAIVVKKYQHVTEADLIRFCRKSLASYKIPISFIQMHQLPRNSSGKLLRRDLSKGVQA